MLADRHGWATAEAYERDPIADDSSDENGIKKAKKGPVFLVEKAKTKRVRVMSRKRNFRSSGGSRTFTKWIFILKCISTRAQIFSPYMLVL